MRITDCDNVQGLTLCSDPHIAPSRADHSDYDMPDEHDENCDDGSARMVIVKTTARNHKMATPLLKPAESID